MYCTKTTSEIHLGIFNAHQIKFWPGQQNLSNFFQSNYCLRFHRAPPPWRGVASKNVNME